MKLLCRLIGHIYYWDNWQGRVCITCSHTITPDWLTKAKAKGLLEWARP